MTVKVTRLANGLTVASDTMPEVESVSLGVYERFLDAFADDPGVWRALPREVSDWWRRRAASTIVTEGGPRVIGPAAHDAAVSMLGAD